MIHPRNQRDEGGVDEDLARPFQDDRQAEEGREDQEQELKFTEFGVTALVTITGITAAIIYK